MIDYLLAAFVCLVSDVFYVAWDCYHLLTLYDDLKAIFEQETFSLRRQFMMGRESLVCISSFIVMFFAG